MTSHQSNHSDKQTAKCGICLTPIDPGREHIHEDQTLCEDCYMDTRTVRTRKTHWQYLRSIKTDYLRPGKDAK
jgi:recombinational DNA repair protein (RecF pathway)